ncbi:hypothetical protein O6P43_029848 [Quillaja saponaria]|uniref:Uncharacterized protein n=1 Tax=Quillaja saponaria TaxID=32244 RepID=A0AAD7L0V6_QUISA|nr:hypothetical protein O6P43_029848 [Quillaja saponaria]
MLTVSLLAFLVLFLFVAIKVVLRHLLRGVKQKTSSSMSYSTTKPNPIIVSRDLPEPRIIDLHLTLIHKFHVWRIELDSLRS